MLLALNLLGGYYDFFYFTDPEGLERHLPTSIQVVGAESGLEIKSAWPPNPRFPLRPLVLKGCEFAATQRNAVQMELSCLPLLVPET